MPYNFKEFKKGAKNRNLSETLRIILEYEIFSERKINNNIFNTTYVKLFTNMKFIEGKYVFDGLSITNEKFDEVPDRYNEELFYQQNYKKDTYGTEKVYNTLLISRDNQNKFTAKHITKMNLNHSVLFEFQQTINENAYINDFQDLYYLIDKYKKSIRKHYKTAYTHKILKEFECFYKKMIEAYNESLERHKEEIKHLNCNMFLSDERFTICCDKECNDNIVAAIKLFNLKMKYLTSTRYGNLEKEIWKIKEIEQNSNDKYFFFEDAIIEFAGKTNFRIGKFTIKKLLNEPVIFEDQLNKAKNWERKKLASGLSVIEEQEFMKLNDDIREQINKHVLKLYEFLRLEDDLNLADDYISNFIERKKNGIYSVVGSQAVGEADRVLENMGYEININVHRDLKEIALELKSFAFYIYKENEISSLTLMEELISQGGEPFHFIGSASIKPESPEHGNGSTENNVPSAKNKTPFWAHVFSIMLFLIGFKVNGLFGLLISIIGSVFIKKTSISQKIKHPFFVSIGIFMITLFIIAVLG